jgi:hypothetical protein
MMGWLPQLLFPEMVAYLGMAASFGEVPATALLLKYGLDTEEGE